MPTNGLDVFRSLMSSATSRRSHGGTDITQKETQSALRSVVFRGNMSVDQGDYAAVKKFFYGDKFLTHATDLAVETARDFLHSFNGRWPDVINAQAPRFEPGKLYSIRRSPLPQPNDGYVWSFRGADSMKPGHVMAVLEPAPTVNGYEEGKLYSVDRSNMPALPAGYAWALSGLGLTPGTVMASVVRG